MMEKPLLITKQKLAIISLFKLKINNITSLLSAARQALVVSHSVQKRFLLRWLISKTGTACEIARFPPRPLYQNDDPHLLLRQVQTIWVGCLFCFKG